MPTPDKALNLLVVEDDAALRDALLITLEAGGFRATGADGGPAALEVLANPGKAGGVHMVVSDLRMSPMDGLTLLGEIRQRHPGLPVMLMTAFGDVDKAVAAMRGGACDFMLKPFSPAALIEAIRRYAVPPAPAEGVIAVDPRTTDTLLLAARVAKTDATVLLTGESGVGKEVFARYIHDQSPRGPGKGGGPFVAINCAAIPENLIEAELFGYAPGAFTGAKREGSLGKLREANGGTLFLDEIGDMPLGMQTRLLRVLQERNVTPLGASKAIEVDFSLVCATHCKLQEAVDKGQFRSDLFYRINGLTVQLPALHERTDFQQLTDRLLTGLNPDRTVYLAPSLLSQMAKFAWPGNLRQLASVLRTASAMLDDDEVCIDFAHLPDDMAEALAAHGARPAASRESREPQNLEELSRYAVRQALEACRGNISLAARTLGISRQTLYRKINLQ